jgi:hypothetical protein
MRHWATALTVAALALPLGGCPPPSYGVSREFDAARLPDPDCIKATITRMPEIKDFRYRPADDKNVFGERTDDRGHLDYWTGRQEDGLVEMRLTSNSHHPALVAHYSMKRDRQAARDGAAATRALMLAVEGQLAERCGMTVVGNVDESLP